MQTEVMFAGFGGQGIMLIGQMLAYAGMNEGKNVVWLPSYGPEMRGGTAYCTVVVARPRHRLADHRPAQEHRGAQPALAGEVRTPRSRPRGC